MRRSFHLASSLGGWSILSQVARLENSDSDASQALSPAPPHLSIVGMSATRKRRVRALGVPVIDFFGDPEAD